MRLKNTRTRLAQLLWLVCVLCALVLAAAALLISLRGVGTNPANSLYRLLVDTGDQLDFGVLSRENGLFDFAGRRSDTKNALVNLGIAAVVWLGIGKLLERIVRP